MIGVLAMGRANGKGRRRSGREQFGRPGSGLPVRGQEATSSELHEERLDAVLGILLRSGVRTVLDLCCGSGSLLRRMVEHEQFSRIVGIDSSAEALALAERLLSASSDPEGERWSLEHRSFSTLNSGSPAPDAITMVETLEHVAPSDLSALERSVFTIAKPSLVLITTPNREYNVLYGLAEGELRHADHRFEWDRRRFRSWAEGVAQRNGYQVDLQDVGRSDPLLGSPTQMAVFRRGQGETVANE
jgi:small RNA 2'-O-methyltransferase